VRGRILVAVNQNLLSGWRRTRGLGLRHLRAYPEVVEDLPRDSGIVGGRNETHSPTASGTIKNFYGEGPAPRIRPSFPSTCPDRGGRYSGYRKGIALGCPLSPIMGAFFLGGLDAQLERLGLFFVRFMDDVLVLAPTRWKLRRAVKVVNEVLGGLRLEKHPEKTFIGRIDKGFDFLGYRFSPRSLSVSAPTLVRFVECTRRLYEQERREPDSPRRLDAYVRRWWGWANAGLSV
jgi:hypothetical protein